MISSTPVMVSRSPDRREDGFTMIEMTIATLMLMILSGLITNMLISGHSASQYAYRLGRVTEISQGIIDNLQAEMRSAVRILGNDSVGLAYRSRLDLAAVSPRIASSTLPVIETTEGFDKDVSGSVKTGNELLFAKHAWSDTFTCSSGSTYRVDVYRIICYYLAKEGDGPTSIYPWGLNLSKFVSEPLVNGDQIDAISNSTDQEEILIHLRAATVDDAGDTHKPATVVWLLGADPSVSGTLREIRADGSLTNSPQLPRANPWKFERAIDRSSDGMLFYRHYSVASNYAQSNQGVSRFAIRNDTAGAGVGYPHGFEIQVVGPAAARKVLIHLTTVSVNMKGLKAYYDIQVIVGMREG